MLDVNLGSYYTNTIKQLPGSLLPRVVNMYNGNPYTSNDSSGGSVIKEIGYLAITQFTPFIRYTFAKYQDEDWLDWKTYNTIGVDAEAYLITSYTSGGDFQRDKGVTYLTVHLRRTETGFEPDMTAVHPSSCLVQARWGWANSDNSGKWGREFQAYRYRVPYFPVDSNDDYDSGFAIISSRNKLRGNGKVLSLRFRTEPGKDLHLYGWSMIFSISENV